eukprot:g15968.t1
MIISFVSQLITALYLLNSQETSRLILVEILLDTGLAFWKLRKAVKIEFKPRFPFVQFGGQKGYEEAGTDKYDEEALRYMYAIALPLFLGFTVRSSLYEKAAWSAPRPPRPRRRGHGYGRGRRSFTPSTGTPPESCPSSSPFGTWYGDEMDPYESYEPNEEESHGLAERRGGEGRRVKRIPSTAAESGRIRTACTSFEEQTAAQKWAIPLCGQDQRSSK